MGALASRAGPGQAQARARPENQNLTGLREEEAKRERARPGAGDAAGAGGAAASATIADEAAGLPPQAEGQSDGDGLPADGGGELPEAGRGSEVGTIDSEIDLEPASGPTQDPLA